MAIQRELCTGCGNCAADCIRGLFELRDGRAEQKQGLCIGCGHCVAVCPAGAIRLPGRDDAECRPYDPEQFDIPPQRLLNFLQFRRSVRRFQPTPVEEETFSALLEAGRYAPTGANLQQVRYIRLRERKGELIQLALRTLHDAAGHMDDTPSLRGLTRYREKWTALYRAWCEHGEDGLFYGADCVLLTVAVRPEGGSGRLDAGLASANVEGPTRWGWARAMSAFSASPRP